MGPIYMERVTPEIEIENKCGETMFPPDAVASLHLTRVEDCPSVLGLNPDPDEHGSFSFFLLSLSSFLT